MGETDDASSAPQSTAREQCLTMEAVMAHWGLESPVLGMGLNEFLQ